MAVAAVVVVVAAAVVAAVEISKKCPLPLNHNRNVSANDRPTTLPKRCGSTDFDSLSWIGVRFVCFVHYSFIAGREGTNRSFGRFSDQIVLSEHAVCTTSGQLHWIES